MADGPRTAVSGLYRFAAAASSLDSYLVSAASGVSRRNSGAALGVASPAPNCQGGLSTSRRSRSRGTSEIAGSHFGTRVWQVVCCTWSASPSNLSASFLLICPAGLMASCVGGVDAFGLAVCSLRVCTGIAGGAI